MVEEAGRVKLESFREASMHVRERLGVLRQKLQANPYFRFRYLPKCMIIHFNCSLKWKKVGQWTTTNMLPKCGDTSPVKKTLAMGLPNLKVQ